MLSKAGLRKLTVMGRKVKVEFLLQDLPAIGGKGSCRLRYLLGGQEKEKSWDIVFVSGGRQMQFLQKLEEAEEMEGIVDCRIFLPGGKEIRGEADAVTEEKQNVEETDVRMQIPNIDKEGKMKQKPESEERQIKKSEEWKETKQKSKSEECQMKKPESKSEKRQMKKSESKSEECQIKKPESESKVTPGDEERSQEMQNKSRVETKESRKETEIPENQVLYIQDLTQLLSMGEKQRELYYNSFLLHGYYQYRHVVAGDGFIGVPGKYVPLKETIRGFKMIIDGEMDEYPESAFFNVGSIDDVIEKAKAAE